MTNWYRIAIKQEAALDVPIWEHKAMEEPFSNALSAMYELEYKRSMMDSHGFRGAPQRQDNMLKQLEARLVENTSYVRKTLLAVLKNWLSNHALLSPQTWANARVRNDEDTEMEEGGKFGNMIWEYLRYEKPDSSRSHKDRNIKFHQLVNNAYNNPNFPEFNNTIGEFFLPDYKNMLYDELSSDGLEEFNNMYRHENPFQTEEQAEEYIDNITTENLDLESLLYFEDFDSFEKYMEMAGNADSILKEFYQNFVFPIWADKWKAEGIEETRRLVEEAYKNLKKASPKDIGNLIVATQTALTVSHQTGDMIEYVDQFTGESDLNALMNSLSDGKNVEEWNQELRRVGVIF